MERAFGRIQSDVLPAAPQPPVPNPYDAPAPPVMRAAGPRVPEYHPPQYRVTDPRWAADKMQRAGDAFSEWDRQFAYNLVNAPFMQARELANAKNPDDVVHAITGIGAGAHAPKTTGERIGQGIAVAAWLIPALRGARIGPLAGAEAEAAALGPVREIGAGSRWRALLDEGVAARGEPRVTGLRPDAWPITSSPGRTGRPSPAVGNLALDIPTYQRQAYKLPARAPQAPTLDMPTFMRRRQEAAGIYQHMVDHGGITLNPVTHEPSQMTGYLVADPAYTHMIPAGEDPTIAISNWMNDPKIRRRLNNPNAHIGGWRDPETGQIEINVTDVIEGEDVARTLGRLRNQKAVGHIERGTYKGDVNLPPDPHPSQTPPRELHADNAAGFYAREYADNLTGIDRAYERAYNPAPDVRAQQHRFAPTPPSTALVPYEQRGTALARIPTPGRSAIAEGLSRDDAIARMKSLSSAGVRADMRRMPDGTFTIMRKGPGGEAGPGTALAKPKPKPKPPAPALGPRGEVTDAGFQSRMMTVLDESPNLPEKATIHEWRVRLGREVSPAEVNDAFDRWARNEYDKRSARGEVPPRGQGSSRSAPDPDQVITRDMVRAITEDFSPARRLETELLDAEGGREMTEGVIREETEQLARDEADYHRNDHVDEEIASREEHFQRLRENLEEMYGPEGGRREFEALMREYEPITGDELREDFGAGIDHNDPDLQNYIDEQIPQYLDRTMNRLGNLYPRDQLALPGIRPEPTSEQIRALFQHLQRAAAQDEEAARAIQYADQPDWDFLRQQAIERLQEGGGFVGEGATTGATEFADYQRVDREAPYREIIITDPESPYTDPHFGRRGYVAHARGEIHNNKWLMIEAQSDFSQRMRRQFGDRTINQLRADEAEAARHPFYPTERWIQLSTGASLKQAADEGLEYFAWVTPEDRARRAHLALEAGEVTYKKGVPEALKRIFRWLDEPMRLEEVQLRGSKYPAVHITPAMRKKILQAGVPALSTIPFLPGLLDQNRK